VELAALDDAALRRHHREVLEALAEGFRIHFRNALAHWIGVGDWMAKTSEWTGTPPEESLHALEGSSPFSVDALGYLDRIAAAVKVAPGAVELLSASGDADERLARLRASSPAVDAAVGEYLDEHGWRIFTGFDLLDKASVEMPESVLRSIAGRLEPAAANDRGPRFAAELRAKVPVQHLAEYDALFETARLLYGVRDDDAGLTAHWTMGLARRVLLEVGRRLVERGSITERDLIFDASIEEVDALLGGAGPKVTGDELASRAATRVANAKDVPPSRLGEDEGPPPPDDWMPAAVARVNGALMLAMMVEVPPPLEGVTDGEVVRGLGASAGVAEGRACVVAGPEDFAKLEQGDILVAQFTTTAYNVVLPMLGGVVTDKGGILSHAAIVAREYAIPAVVNTGNGTALIADGSRIRIDGAAGMVEVLVGSGVRPVVEAGAS
jgi:pyruvate,water dikinase